MQQAVFLFTQIFFVVLAVSVIGMVIYAVIKRRDKNDPKLVNDKDPMSKPVDE